MYHAALRACVHDVQATHPCCHACPCAQWSEFSRHSAVILTREASCSHLDGLAEPVHLLPAQNTTLVQGVPKGYVSRSVSVQGAAWAQQLPFLYGVFGMQPVRGRSPRLPRSAPSVFGNMATDRLRSAEDSDTEKSDAEVSDGGEESDGEGSGGGEESGDGESDGEEIGISECGVGEEGGEDETEKRVPEGEGESGLPQEGAADGPSVQRRNELSDRVQRRKLQLRPVNTHKSYGSNDYAKGPKREWFNFCKAAAGETVNGVVMDSGKKSYTRMLTDIHGVQSEQALVTPALADEYMVTYLLLRGHLHTGKNLRIPDDPHASKVNTHTGESILSALYLVLTKYIY